MTTVRDIVQAAYRKIGVAASGEPIADDEAAEGVFTFNLMMHSFKARNADILHSDLGLNDAITLPVQFREGLVYMLAGRLSPDFMTPAAFDADQWFRELQAAYGTIPSLTVPAAVLRPPSREDREGNLPLVES